MDFLILIGVAVISVLLCFLGIKMMRIFNAVAGAILGAGIAYTILGFVQVDTRTQWIIIGVSALVLAVLTGVVRKVGCFVFSLVAITGMLSYVLNASSSSDNWLLYAISGGVAMLIALLGIKWMNPIYIVSGAFAGGIGLGSVLLNLPLPDVSNPMLLKLAVYGVPVLIGCVVQFILKSREIGRKEAKHSAEVKKEISMEEEVENARALFNDDVDDIEMDDMDVEDADVDTLDVNTLDNEEVDISEIDTADDDGIDTVDMDTVEDIDAEDMDDFDIEIIEDATDVDVDE